MFSVNQPSKMDPVIIKDDGEVLIPLGSRGNYLCASNWSNYERFHVRNYFRKDLGAPLTAGKGIALYPDEFENLIKKAPLARTHLKSLIEAEEKKRQLLQERAADLQ